MPVSKISALKQTTEAVKAAEFVIFRIGQKTAETEAGAPGVGSGETLVTHDAEWQYDAIRRVLPFVERGLGDGTEWSVFEGDADAGRSTLRFGDGVAGRLPAHTPEWTNPTDSDPGATVAVVVTTPRLVILDEPVATKPDFGAAHDAFLFRPNGEPTARDADLGIVSVQIGFAPLKPAEARDSHDRYANAEISHLVDALDREDTMDDGGPGWGDLFGG